MAVAFDAASESHTGATGSASEASFSWPHIPSGDPTGILVYTFVNANADNATAISYQGASLTAVTNGRAVDTAGEPGDCKTWFLGTGVPTTGGDPSGTWVSSSDGSGSPCYGLDFDGTYWLATHVTSSRYSTDLRGPWTAGAGASATTGYIVYGNGYWAATSSTGAVSYATNPTTATWSTATSGASFSTSIAYISYGGGYWTLVGSGGGIRYKATNPTGTWSGATSGTSNSLTAIAYGDGYWAAVGNSGTIRYKATDPSGSWSGATSGTTNNFLGVAYGNGYWVAVGFSGIIRYRATDPAGTWSAPTSSGTTNNLRKVAYGDGYWVAVGSGGTILYATDPTGTWTAATSGTTNDLFSVIYKNKAFVIGGAADTILIAAPTVTVTRTNNANEMYAVAITVTASRETEVTGIVRQENDQALAATAVDDGLPGTDSLRFAGVNSGLAAPPTPNSGSTEVASIDFGTRVISTIRETTPGQGSRNIGWTASSDDVAAVYLAVRETAVAAGYVHSGWGIPIR